MSDTRQSLINHSVAMAAHGLAALLTLETVLGADPFRTLTNLRGAGDRSPTWLTIEQQASTAWGILVAWEPDQHAAYRLVANALEDLGSDYDVELSRQCCDLAKAIRAGVGDVRGSRRRRCTLRQRLTATETGRRRPQTASGELPATSSRPATLTEPSFAGLCKHLGSESRPESQEEATMPDRIVRLRRYPTGHVFAEYGKINRTVGNIVEISRVSGWGWSSLDVSGWGWSSLDAEGVVYMSGGAGAKLAEQAMVDALRAEGFEVDTTAPPRKQAIECLICGPYGRKGCTTCHGTGRVWPGNDEHGGDNG